MTTPSSQVTDPSSSEGEIPVALQDHHTNIALDSGPEVLNFRGEKEVFDGYKKEYFFMGRLVGVSYCDPFSRKEGHLGLIDLERS